ncbi:MAG: DUF1266 domain-containing protein [Candidatus Omnitrophica bacterium]|nr:DUF1266 domain-containing protein [Candidatus Omnitrophota bacterium]
MNIFRKLTFKAKIIVLISAVVIFLLVLLLLFRQTVIVKKRYPDGKLLYIARYDSFLYMKGQKIAHHKEFYHNGKLKEEWDTVNGNVEGKRRSFYESGEIMAAKEYKNNQFHGYSKAFFKNGKLQGEEQYSNGLKSGHVLSFSETGQLLSDIVYANGQLYGESVWYHPDGKLKAKESYKADLKHGKFETYNEKGQLESRAIYKDGLLDGMSSLYFPTGELSSEIEYTKGKKNGIERVFYISGKPYSERINDMGVPREDKIFEENGKMKMSVNYDGKKGKEDKKEYSVASGLTPAQNWALAASGVLIEYYHGRHDYLAPMERTEANVLKWRDMLANEYEIKDQSALVDVLVFLKDEQHRDDLMKIPEEELAEFEDIGFFVAAKTFLEGNFHNKRDVVRLYGGTLKERSVIAWDFVRYIALCRWGFMAGYLTEQEAWGLIMPAAHKLQSSFKSWEELGQNYLLGRLFWIKNISDRKMKDFNVGYQKLLSDPTSPWLKYDWNLDLR